MDIKTKIRPAIAMIELIFALVVLGIVMMSAPTLISTATKSGYVTIQQEGISEASTRVNMVMGYAWDERNAESDDSYIILGTNSGVSDLNETNRTLSSSGFILEGYRRGTPMESLRNFKGSGNWRISATDSSSLGTDSVESVEDDMDDFAGTVGLQPLGGATDVNYIETNATIVTEVTYNQDDTVEGAAAGGTDGYQHSDITFNPFVAASGTSSNIKEIKVTLTSASSSPDELDKEIILRAFSCNIGGYRLEERSF